ncbi:MAG: EAL domain-containing protein [Halomonas subglaciescola]|nr:EAL domain-containing protein [Halomonas subglaciescola]
MPPPLDAALMAPYRLEDALKARRDTLPLVDELTVMDTRGRVRASSSAYHPPGFDLSRMTYFRAFQETPDLEQDISPLYWSAFIRDYYIAYTRRLRDANGDFAGLVTARLAPRVFDDTLAKLSMRAGETIALVDSDQQLLARRHSVAGEDSLNVPVSSDRLSAFFAGEATTASMWLTSPLDDTERLYWLQKLPDLPYTVIVGDRMDSVLDGWQQRAWALSLIAAAVALLGAWGLRHYLNRLRLAQQLVARISEREAARAQAQMREARLEALVGSIQDMIFVFDEGGRMTYLHAVDKQWLLRDAGAMLGSYYGEVLPRRVSDELDVAFERVKRGGNVEEFPYTLWMDGQQRYFHAILSPLAARDGHFDGILMAARDVTQAREDEADLRIAATAFHTHLGMMITDDRGNILKVNATFSRITGYSEQEVLGKNPRMLSSGRHDAAFYQALWGGVARTGSWEGEVWNRRKDGNVYPEWLTLSAVRDGSGALTHYVATLSDLTERKAAEREIQWLAFYDPLTGLANRRLFLDRVSDALKSHRREASHGALLFIDLDNFKQVNDTLGHYAGDQLLQRMAGELSDMLRDSDTLSRLGGDEFAVLVHQLDDNLERAAEQAERIAHKLLAAIHRPVMLDSGPVVITGSIGIAMLSGAEDGVETCLQQADMALFQAKTAGRNTLAFFDPQMQKELLGRTYLEGDLRQALWHKQWRLFYQPQVDEHGELTGVEALLRWEHPTRGMVSPGDFIPLLESTKMINDVGAWVIETACEQLVAWQDDPQTARWDIAVNISPVQFREDDFVPRMKAILQRTGAPATRLKLEVTETLFVEAQDDARQKMQHLQEHGLRFSLDDFGTGYSSLAYLAHLPLDQLKIDQSFVRQLPASAANGAIVESTIALAQSLGLAVIAEGVETDTQRQWLAAHRCHAFQGYLFGRPLPVAELEAQWQGSGATSL